MKGEIFMSTLQLILALIGNAIIVIYITNKKSRNLYISLLFIIIEFSISICFIVTKARIIYTFVPLLAGLGIFKSVIPINVKYIYRILLLVLLFLIGFSCILYFYKDVIFYIVSM